MLIINAYFLYPPKANSKRNLFIPQNISKNTKTMNLMQRILIKSRTWRDHNLQKIALFFLKIKISANIMTFFSLLLGLIAIYYLFQNHFLFIIFGLLHLLADGLDGVIARYSTTTAFGKYFDYTTDRIVEAFLLLKIGWQLHDYYPYFILGIMIITQLIYIISQFQAPIFFSRTLMVIILIFQLPVLAYLSEGLLVLFSLGLPLQYFSRQKL